MSSRTSQTAWRNFADWAKHNPATLRLADALGRGQGRLRVLDQFDRKPPMPRLVPDVSSWENHTLAAAWLGHATNLVRVGTKTILIDPVFSNRVGLSLGLMTGGPRRFVAPALSMAQLPQIDLVIVSHAHFDHLDRPSLRRLPKHTPIVTSAGCRDLLADMGFRRVIELRWNEKVTIDDVTITCREVKHWGARTFFDVYRGYGAFLIETSKHRILYGADTAYHELFKDLRHIDVAILGIGAYDPWVQAHSTPEQAWAMAEHMHAERVIAMHHSTFRLSHEPMHEPIERLLTAAGNQADRVAIREIGETLRG